MARDGRPRYPAIDPGDRMDAKVAADRLAALAAALRARRKLLRLTQIDLSRLAGCGPDFVYDVEAGKPTLRLDKLLDLLEVLGLELVLAPGKLTLRVAAELLPAQPVERRRRVAGARRPPAALPRGGKRSG